MALFCAPFRYLTTCVCIAAATAAVVLVGKSGGESGGQSDPIVSENNTPSNPNREHVIKAAYLHQFGRYVRWPAKTTADPEKQFVIGVLGTSPVAGILKDLAKTKKLDDRQVVVKQFNRLEEYTTCHVLFVAASASDKEKKLAIHRFQNSSVLLVGEEPGFASQGGMINLALIDNRIRIEINLETARQAGLEISSKLLSLAKIVATH